MTNSPEAQSCNKSPLFLLLVVSVIVFVTEFLLMQLIPFLHLSPGLEMFLDSFILIVLIFPALLIFVYKPLHAALRKNETMRAAVAADHERLLTVLDSLDAIIYVADMKTYELIFLNKFARNLFGNVAGKKCWEALQSGQTGPCVFCSNKELVSPSGEVKGAYAWEFQNTINGSWYDIRDRAIYWIDGRLVRLEVATDVTVKKNAEKEREQLIGELQCALDEVETLRGIIPICSHCKKIRDDQGLWNQLEAYITQHSEAEFSHGVCPECVKEHYDGYLKKL